MFRPKIAPRGWNSCGREMTGFDDFTMSLITNEAVLKMHASSKNARQVFRRKTDGKECILWTADECDGGKYIAVFNAGDEDGVFEILLEELEGIPAGSKATELWSGESISLGSVFCPEIAAHGAKLWYIG